MTITLTIPGRLTQAVANQIEASAVYAAAREQSGEGGSTFPEGQVHQDGRLIARVSYNARVWELDARKPDGGGILIYCPSSAHEDEGRPDIFNEGRESVWGRKVPNPYLEGTLKHRVFERGAAYARTFYA